MKKNSSKGFMLAETLVVTTFVVGILIFLFIQFSNLSKNYGNSYIYNSVEHIYMLNNIKNYIMSDTSGLTTINDKVTKISFLEITDCSIFSEQNYCLKLFELEGITKLFVTLNDFDKELFYNYEENIKKFVDRINSDGEEKYRLIAEFNDNTYATIRFGE